MDTKKGGGEETLKVADFTTVLKNAFHCHCCCGLNSVALYSVPWEGVGDCS